MIPKSAKSSLCHSEHSVFAPDIAANLQIQVACFHPLHSVAASLVIGEGPALASPAIIFKCVWLLNLIAVQT